MFHRIFAACCCATLLAGATGAEVRTDTPLAKVGDVEITAGHVVVAIDALSPAERQMPADELFESLLERLIQQEQLAQQAGGTSLMTRLQIENSNRMLMATQVVENILNQIEVTEEDTREAYERRFGSFTPGREYNAAHILVETEEEAQNVIARLEEGVAFDVLARRFSVGPSGPNGGNLGWFSAGRMVPEFQAVVESLDEGAYSEPVQTQFGWHVIMLMDTRLPNVPEYEDILPELEGEVVRTRFRTSLDAALAIVPVERFEVEDFDPAAVLGPLLEAPTDE